VSSVKGEPRRVTIGVTADKDEQWGSGGDPKAGPSALDLIDVERGG
jgi:hypothetical protein